jgi:hypothetical protein
MKEAGVDVLKPVQVSEKKNCCFSGPRWQRCWKPEWSSAN